MTVPSTPPSPPVKLVPPMSTAASTVSRSVGSTVAEAAVSRPTWTIAARAAARPAIA